MKKTTMRTVTVLCLFLASAIFAGCAYHYGPAGWLGLTYAGLAVFWGWRAMRAIAEAAAERSVKREKEERR